MVCRADHGRRLAADGGIGGAGGPRPHRGTKRPRRSGSAPRSRTSRHRRSAPSATIPATAAPAPERRGLRRAAAVRVRGAVHRPGQRRPLPARRSRSSTATATDAGTASSSAAAATRRGSRRRSPTASRRGRSSSRNDQQTIAVEVLDQEGLFNIYQAAHPREGAADGYHLDGIFISATHDESAPDTLGISGVDQTTSGVDAYYVDFLVRAVGEGDRAGVPPAAAGADQVRGGDRTREPAPVLLVVSVRRRSADAVAAGGRRRTGA